MGFFKRLKNILRSNLYSKHESLEDIIYNDVSYTADDDNTKEYETSMNNNTQEIHKDMESEYYAILEVEYGSNFEKIKNGYRRLLRKYHPDLYQNKQHIAMKLTEKINEAYSYFENKFK